MTRTQAPDNLRLTPDKKRPADSGFFVPSWVSDRLDSDQQHGLIVALTACVRALCLGTTADECHTDLLRTALSVMDGGNDRNDLDNAVDAVRRKLTELAR